MTAVNYIMHQSIPAVPIPPPPPSGKREAFTLVVSPGGGGALANFIAALGLGISTLRGELRAFDTCFRKMDESIGKDEAFAKDWLVLQELEKPVNVFTCTGMFSQF